MAYRSLTGLARDAVKKVMQHGDSAIDATVGNGHDSLFLAQQLGPHGKVLGFDIQPDAITKTRERLHQAELEDRVMLHCASHDTLEQKVHTTEVQRISAVMFNLGYLPGGDKSIITLAQTTHKALQQASRVVSAGGLISVLSYRGHAGGQHEYLVLERTLDRLDSKRFNISRETVADTASSTAPILFLISKLT